MIYWYFLLHTTNFEALPICYYAYHSARLQFLKTFLEFFPRDGLHCSHLSFLNIHCNRETMSFKNSLSKISLWTYTCCNRYNDSVINFSKHWKNSISSCRFSNTFSTFNECERLQFTDTHSLENLHWKRTFASWYVMSHIPLCHGKIVPLSSIPGRRYQHRLKNF